jgi:hypothetical protein
MKAVTEAEGWNLLASGSSLTRRRAGRGGASRVKAILMMNDPDEAMKLTTPGPTGGIVSLHELPDFVRSSRQKMQTRQFRIRVSHHRF